VLGIIFEKIINKTIYSHHLWTAAEWDQKAPATKDPFLDIWWLDCLWWSSTPARGPQDGPNVHHGLSLMS
jgi:hypothetical protein